MKKRFIVLITSVILMLCVFLSGCEFMPENCLWNNNGEITNELMPDESISSTSITLTMVKKDGFYYPTFEGVIVFDYYPEKITVECAGVKQRLDPISIEYKNDMYEFGFNQVILFGSLNKGEYEIKAYGYSKNKKTTITSTNNFIVDDDYFLIYMVDDATGENKVAMDKESNWSDFY